MFSNQHTGTMPLPQAVDTFYTADVFMHTWDLARATGQDETLDADFCATLLAGMEPIEELMRALGSVRRHGAPSPTTPPSRTGCSASSAATRPGALLVVAARAGTAGRRRAGRR